MTIVQGVTFSKVPFLKYLESICQLSSFFGTNYVASIQEILARHVKNPTCTSTVIEKKIKTLRREEGWIFIVFLR